MIVMTVTVASMSPVTVSVSAPVTVVVIVPGTQAGAGSHVLEEQVVALGRCAVSRTVHGSAAAEVALGVAHDVLGVCGGRHLQLEPPAIVVAAQGPEVGLMDSLNPLELHHLLVRIW